MIKYIKNAKILGRKETCIGIENGSITYIGADVPEGIDAKNNIILPSFTNAHTHLPMTLLRGVADSQNLQDWLYNHVFPIESKLTEEDIYYGSLLALSELIETGTTEFYDMYFMTDAIAKAAEESGLHSHLSLCLANDDYSKFHKAAKYDHISVHSVYTSGTDYLSACADFSKEQNKLMHIHISETEQENRDCLSKYGVTPTRLLSDLGFFQTPTLCAHCVHLTDEDIVILKNANATIVHNPVSNLKLQSGLAPIKKYINAGINVLLGTDGAASNNNLSILKELQVSSLLHPGVDLVSLATANRKIEIGAKADLIIIKSDPVEISDPHSTICYYAREVVSTMINGDFIYKNGEHKRLDIEKIKYGVKQSCKRLYS